MGMFGPKLGSWWINSKSDPRWNASGEGYGLVSTGGPGEMYDEVKKIRERLNEEPPEDLEVGFHKY